VNLGDPIKFKTGGLKGAVPTLDGVVDEILVKGFAYSVAGEDGTYWLVLSDEVLEIHVIH
jgi:hypothetical protein